MKLLYFASLSRAVGLKEEVLSPPPQVADIQALVDWLKSRDPRYANAFNGCARLCAAVNQNYVGFDHPVGENDEIAFFPPVTGG